MQSCMLVHKLITNEMLQMFCVGRAVCVCENLIANLVPPPPPHALSSSYSHIFVLLLA